MDESLDSDDIVAVLDWATSPDQSRRESAEKQLELYKRIPQFYVILMVVKKEHHIRKIAHSTHLSTRIYIQSKS